jgi:predicted DNA-binding protein (MmcQ/YjbR family)
VARNPHQTLRAHALAKDGAWEDHPWGPEGDVFKTSKGKIFAMWEAEGSPGPCRVTLRLTAEEAQDVLNLPFVQPAPYLARYHWVQVEVANEGALDLALEWMDRSYELVAGGAKARKR